MSEISNGAGVETRRFKMHENLLVDVIKRQAGTVQKAILEGVMNSVDAGSTQVNVIIQPFSVTITDDGKGFRGREEVELFFETFGQPHEKGDAKYGRFRMGRGQMFAFGKNVWRTGEFKMLVDINALGLDYKLEEGLPHAQGCAIDIALYDGLSAREIKGVRDEIAKMVRYVDIPVMVNGEQVSSPPDERRFPHSTDDAFIRLNDGHALEVYNLGVFVKSYSKWEFGCAGVIVSKAQLDVNFARNDVIRSCPVWTAIRKVVDTRSVERIRRKLTLNDDERINVIRRITSGEMKPEEAYKMQIFKDTSGKAWSPYSLARAKYVQVTASYENDPVGDALTSSGQCLVLDSEVLAAFEVSPSEVFERFDFYGYRTGKPAFVGYGEAKADLSGEVMPVQVHKWTPREREWIAVIGRMTRELVGHANQRDIRVGMSDTSFAWTDGRSHITFERVVFKDHRLTKHDLPNYCDLFRVGNRLVSMLCHDSDSRAAGQTPEWQRAVIEMTKKLPDAVESAAMMLTPAMYGKLRERAKQETARARRAAGVAEAQPDDDEQGRADDRDEKADQHETLYADDSESATAVESADFGATAEPGDGIDLDKAMRMLGDDDDDTNLIG